MVKNKQWLHVTADEISKTETSTHRKLKLFKNRTQNPDECKINKVARLRSQSEEYISQKTGYKNRNIM